MLAWTRKKLILLAIAGCAVAVVIGCGGGGGGSSGGGGGGPVAVVASLTDDAGNAVTALPAETAAPVFVGVDGLQPGQEVEAMLYKNGVAVYPAPMRLTANEQGKVPTSAIMFDVGVDQVTGKEIDPAGSYSLRVTGQGVDKTVSFTIGSRGGRAGTGPVIYPLVPDPSGYIHTRGSVLVGEMVYVKGSGFAANAEVHIFLAADKADWTGASLVDARGNSTTVTADANGIIAPTLIWNSAQRIIDPADFDVIADAAPFGVIGPEDAVNGQKLTGFTVQETNVRTEVPLATDQHRSYRSTYDKNDTLTVWVNPPGRPTFPAVEGQYRMVRKYVVLYKDTWQDQDQLIDVTGRDEWDIVRYACANQYHYPIWSPPLKPGHYDVIIDIDKDGKFDLGSDLIHVYNGVRGVYVQGSGPARLVLSVDPAVVSPNQSAAVYVTALAKDTGLPVEGVAVAVSVVSGGGVNPATITTDANGMATTTFTPTRRGVTVNLKATAAGYEDGTGTVRIREAGDLNVVVQ